MSCDERAYVTKTDEGYVGWIESDRGVRRSTLPQASLEEAMARLGRHGEYVEPADHPVARELARFFQKGQADLATVTLDLPSETEFESAVRDVVRHIPGGSTMSYGEVAAAAGRPGAARAVGRVMATNPVPPFIPCHRVVAADGGLGGYGGGLEMKLRLLEREREA